MCSFIVLMSSILICNVEKYLNKEKPLNEKVCPNFWQDELSKCLFSFVNGSFPLCIKNNPINYVWAVKWFFTRHCEIPVHLPLPQKWWNYTLTLPKKCNLNGIQLLQHYREHSGWVHISCGSDTAAPTAWNLSVEKITIGSKLRQDHVEEGRVYIVVCNE